MRVYRILELGIYISGDNVWWALGISHLSIWARIVFRRNSLFTTDYIILEDRCIYNYWWMYWSDTRPN